MLTHSIRIYTILPFLMSLFLLIAVSATLKDKGEWIIDIEDEPEFKKFLFRGSIEPKIEPEHMKRLKHYEILVHSNTTIPDWGMGWLDWGKPVKAQTDHQFSIELLVRVKESARISKLKQKFKSVLPEKWHPSESDYSRNEIEAIRVQVKAQFHDDEEIIRKWIIGKPDFSLHYTLNVGVLEGSDYWFRAKIALSPIIMNLLPEDEFEISSMGNNILFRAYFNERLTENANISIIKDKVNILKVAFKLNSELVNKLLTNFSEELMIKFSFERDEFREYFREEKAKKQISMVKRGHNSKRKEAENKGETSDKARGMEQSENFYCSICLNEEEGKQWCSQNCGHCFHLECITKWVKTESHCPMCRNPFRRKSFLYFEGPVFSNAHYSFEYKFTMQMTKDFKMILEGEKVREFLEERGTQEQIDFLKKQFIWTDTINKTPLTKSLGVSRIRTVVVTRLTEGSSN